jgi:toxin secretion/phage lysis holin
MEITNKPLHLSHLSFTGKPAFMLAFTIPVSLIVKTVETYVFSDWQFLKFLLVLISVDTLLGLVLSFKNHRLSSLEFSRLFTKMLVYLGFLVLTHILCHFTVEGRPNTLFGWFSTMAYSAIVVRESLSIFEHFREINPNLVPKWLVNRLKAFDANGPDSINSNQVS